MSEFRTQLKELESLKVVATEVKRILGDVRDAAREVQDLERQLESSGSSRTADDVQGELRVLADKITTLKKECEGLTRDRDANQERLRACDSEISRTQLKLKDAERSASVRATAQNSKNDAEKEKTDLQERFEGVDKKIKDNEPTVQKLRKELRDAQDQQREKEAYAAGEADNIAKGYEQLKRTMDDVKRLRRADIKSRLRACDAKIRELENTVKDQLDTQNQLREKISQIDKEENDSKNLQRNVSDNITFREYKEEIKKLETEIAGKDLEGAMKARRQFDKEYESSKKKLAEVQNQVRAPYVGRDLLFCGSLFYLGCARSTRKSRPSSA